QKQILYYVFHIEKTGASVKYIDFAFPISRNKYIDVPVIEMLSNGSMLIAYGFFSSDKSNVVKGISISKYDSNFNLLGTNEIVATTDLVALASTTPNAKKENGFPFLELQQVLPLESGGFMLIAEYHRVTDNADKLKPSILERNYIITYRVDDKLVLKGSNFIPKKQSSSKIGYALSTVAYHKGNEVYLVHNDDWTSDAEHDTNLQRTWISAKGTAPETTKITHTSDDFFTSMEHIYLRSDGKILLTEEKLVEFENVSREIKLLEVTPK
ncbi:MAG: hypothetical protein JWO06_2837, partial [Bacteroidota bacterium]|nr:hypothetical protein [Bacteroidota bacterium]